MRKYIFYIMLMASLFSFSAQAQKIKDDKVIIGQVLDVNNKAVGNVDIVSTISRNISKTDIAGNFKINVSNEDYLAIDEKGYRKIVVPILRNGEKMKIILTPWYQAESGEKIRIAFGKQDFDRLTGAATVIAGDELESMGSYNVIEALTGRVSGLKVSYGDTRPYSESFGLSLRGEGGFETRVDGMPGSSDINVDEIKNVVILKDLAGSSLFGGTGSNGAIFYDTKQGIEGESSINVRYNHGIQQTAFLPDMMDGLSFAKMYDRALLNDGNNPIYGQSAYEGIQSQTNPLRYPNIDYYDKFIGKSAYYDRATANFKGGGKTARYFSSLDLYNAKGIETYNTSSFTRVRLRSNLMVNLNDFMNLDLGIGGNFSSTKRSNYDSNTLFDSMHKIPGCALPFIVGQTEDKQDIFGITRYYSTNLLAETAYKGTQEANNRNGFTRLGLNIDLSDLVTKGLSFDAYLNMYINNSVAKSLNPSVYTSYVSWIPNSDTGEDEISLLTNGVGAKDNSWGKVSDYMTRDYNYYFKLTYDRSFGENNKLTADLAFSRHLGTGSTYQQDLRKQSFGLRMNYFYKNKYAIEGSLTTAGVQALSDDNKYDLFYHGGIAWIASREEFLKDVSWLNYLKVRANYGVTGVYFGNVDNSSYSYYMDQDFYGNPGGYGFGIPGATSSAAASYNRLFTGNKDVNWPMRKQLNIGVDARMFNNSVKLQANYFNGSDYDNIIRVDNFTPILSTAYMYYINYSKYSYSGADIDLSFNNWLGKLKYTLGVNFLYRKTFTNLANEVTYPDTESWRNSTGKAGGRIMGLTSDGLFKNQEEVDAYNAKYRTYFGDVKVGDIKYVDYNGDNVIDNRDNHQIAKGSRMNYGVYASLSYKGFTLSAHGEGIPDGKYINNMYQFSGSNNYYKAQADAFPATDKLPRPSVYGVVNNNRNSDFWLRSAAYFNLKNVSLIYSLPKSLINKLYLSGVDFHVSGNNLCVFSSESDRFSASRNKGISEYPVMRSLEMGLSLTF